MLTIFFNKKRYYFDLYIKKKVDSGDPIKTRDSNLLDRVVHQTGFKIPDH